MSFSGGLALPIASMMLLTLIVWVVLFIKRIGFMQTHQVDVAEMKAPEDTRRLIPGAPSAPADNLNNLSELPIVFYAVCFYLTVFTQVDQLHVICAWVFVGFRAVHSLIHCTYNTVMHRFMANLISSIALWVMVVRAFLAAV